MIARLRHLLTDDVEQCPLCGGRGVVSRDIHEPVVEETFLSHGEPIRTRLYPRRVERAASRLTTAQRTVSAQRWNEVLQKLDLPPIGAPEVLPLTRKSNVR
jgi:hypothetical protein